MLRTRKMSQHCNNPDTLTTPPRTGLLVLFNGKLWLGYQPQILLFELYDYKCASVGVNIIHIGLNHGEADVLQQTYQLI